MSGSEGVDEGLQCFTNLLQADKVILLLSLSLLRKNMSEFWLQERGLAPDCTSPVFVWVPVLWLWCHPMDLSWPAPQLWVEVSDCQRKVSLKALSWLKEDSQRPPGEGVLLSLSRAGSWWLNRLKEKEQFQTHLPGVCLSSYSYFLALGSSACGFDWIAILSHLILLFLMIAGT